MSSAEYRENTIPASHSVGLQGFFFRLLLKEGAGKYFQGRLLPLGKVYMLLITTVKAARLFYSTVLFSYYGHLKFSLVCPEDWYKHLKFAKPDEQMSII